MDNIKMATNITIWVIMWNLIAMLVILMVLHSVRFGQFLSFSTNVNAKLWYIYAVLCGTRNGLGQRPLDCQRTAEKAGCVIAADYGLERVEYEYFDAYFSYIEYAF